MKSDDFVHPYIPNSVPEIKQKMLDEVGAKDADELYKKMIPERLLLNTGMNLPEPLIAEYDLARHVDKILSRNKTCSQYLNFRGAGCWQHFVPEVCDVIISRSELLTSYAGNTYADAGRHQILFEFQSLLGELVDMDVGCLPTYDWGSSAGNALRMTARSTGRSEVLVSSSTSPSRLSIMRNYCDSVDETRRIRIRLVDFGEDGTLDIEDLKNKISDKTAGVYFENPSFFGAIEDECHAITQITHDNGAIAVAGVDPSSLGVLAAPGEYDADICCGDAQPLGIHMNAGGGTTGFIASKDDMKLVSEFPGILTGIATTDVPGTYGFGSCFFERTSYDARENAKDWVGTLTSLWAIAGATYLSLMGPEGMKELGETILKKSHYAAKLIGEIPGANVPYSSFFKEFPITFEESGKTVSQINKELLEHEIFGGVDISRDFPELGQCGLYCVTETHSKEDLDRLADVLGEVLQ